MGNVREKEKCSHKSVVSGEQKKKKGERPSMFGRFEICRKEKSEDQVLDE